MFLPTRADLCNLIFLNKQSGNRRTLNVFLPTRADLCNLIFLNKQSGSRRTLRAFLYFICFTFNAIRQGPLNIKHRSLHAISYSGIKTHLLFFFYLCSLNLEEQF